MKRYRKARRPVAAHVEHVELRRRRWRGAWLRPRRRWGIVAGLSSAVLAAAASASVFTVTQGAVAHTSHLVQHLLHDETASSQSAIDHTQTPAQNQYVALAAARPNIAITEDPSSQKVELGGTANFTISVTNTGTVTLHSVHVDPPVRTCDRSVGVLGPKEGITYTCTFVGVTKSLVNPVTVTGLSPAGTKVTAHDRAKVTVVAPLAPPLTPAIAVAKMPHSQVVLTRVVHLHTASGTHTSVMYGYAWFTITVKNTGHLPLVDVMVHNKQAPACDRRFARLAVGAAHSYRCYTLAVRDEPANLALAVGRVKAGGTVTATANAAVIVHIKTVNSGTVSFAG